MRPPHLCLSKASDQLFLMDKQGRIINANQAACLSLGYSREELVAMHFGDINKLFTPEVWKRHWQELEKSQSLRFASEHQGKNGSIESVDIGSRFITLDSQEYICAIAQNRAGQTSCPSELQESDERFRLLFENAAIGMARVSVNGEFLQVNDAFCQLMGYSREEILAKSITFQQLTYTHDLNKSLASYQQLLQGEILSFSTVTRYVHKQGAIVWVNLSVSLLRDPSGTPLYLIGTALDVSSSKQTEECQHLAAAVFNHTHDGIVVTDLQGRIESINPAFTVLTGYEETEVMGENIRLLHSEKNTATLCDNLKTSIQSEGHWRGEIWSRHKNGEAHPHLMTVSSITNALGETVRYVGVFSDITQLKEAETRLNFLAHHDPLTGLANRRLLELRVEHALDIARRNRLPLALLMIDLDNFKIVNDSLGHQAGDEMLKEVGARLSSRLRETDTLARLGGDEFAILLESPTNKEAAGRVAQDLLAGLELQGTLNDGTKIVASASIGISLFPDHGDSFGDLLRHADAALYQAKREGRRTFRYAIT